VTLPGILCFEGGGKRRLWPELGYHDVINLRRTEEYHEQSVGIVSFRAELWNGTYRIQNRMKAPFAASTEVYLQNFFSSPKRPHRAARLTQPPIQWVPDFFLGGKAAAAWRWSLTSHLVLILRMSGVIRPFLSYDSMASTGTNLPLLSEQNTKDFALVKICRITTN
jgi:hypothetical protein